MVLWSLDRDERVRVGTLDRDERVRVGTLDRDERVRVGTLNRDDRVRVGTLLKYQLLEYYSEIKLGISTVPVLGTFDYAQSNTLTSLLQITDTYIIRNYLDKLTVTCINNWINSCMLMK